MMTRRLAILSLIVLFGMADAPKPAPVPAEKPDPEFSALTDDSLQRIFNAINAEIAGSPENALLGRLKAEYQRRHPAPPKPADPDTTKK
jgi:hypothetical protein